MRLFYNFYAWILVLYSVSIGFNPKGVRGRWNQYNMHNGGLNALYLKVLCENNHRLRDSCEINHTRVSGRSRVSLFNVMSPLSGSGGQAKIEPELKNLALFITFPTLAQSQTSVEILLALPTSALNPRGMPDIIDRILLPLSIIVIS